MFKNYSKNSHFPGFNVGHGSVIMERAGELIHAVTPKMEPSTIFSERTGLVLFTHEKANLPQHGRYV